MGKPLKDLTGNTYGRVEVLTRAPNKVYENGRCKVFWNCRCSCGVEFTTAGDYLKKGDTKSCGCYNKEILKAKKTKLISENKREYSSYNGMKSRCKGLTEGSTNNAYYRDKGIAVCKEWNVSNGFAQFMKDMGKCPEGFTLDRKDGNLGYSPDNCRWASFADQCYNRGLAKHNTTGVKGVVLQGRSFIASISHKKVKHYLGSFSTLEKAAEARLSAELMYYGVSSPK